MDRNREMKATTDREVGAWQICSSLAEISHEIGCLAKKRLQNFQFGRRLQLPDLNFRI